MLVELGFPSTFISWIRACVLSVSYSILVNGRTSTPFNARKGLRQGDPLSPFLFALTMEYLSRCLGELNNNPDFNFHPKCERIQLTHLMFADDQLLFCRADHSLVSKICTVVEKPFAASGLHVSPEKSNIYLVGVNPEEAASLAEVSNMNLGTLPFRYLGITLSAKKLTYSQCKPLIERITARAQGWIAKLLSYAGCLQLVRSVLSSMQNYWGHIFPLPKKVIKDVEGICRRFLWTGILLSPRKLL